MARSSSFSYAFLSEMLSSPKIKPLVQRLHPSAVLPVLKSAFDDVSGELWSAVTEQRRPEINELVEKIVDRLKDLIGVSEPLVVDARGRVCPNDYERLAPAAIEEGSWILSEPQTDYSKKQDEKREKELRSKLAKLAGAEAAVVFPNCAIARAAVLNALISAEKSLVVARKDMYQRENGERLEDVFNAFPNLKRREVGACNAVTVDDYDRACDASTGLVWRALGRWSQEDQRVSASDIAGLKGTSGRSFRILVELEFAPLIGLSEYLHASMPTVGERLKSGFDFVLCNGAQLIGGPSCGLLFGPRHKLDEIMRTPIARFTKTNRVTLGILAKTLSFYDDRTTALETIPVLRTLSTSQANLESRAKRLAGLLETCECVQYARAIEGTSPLCANAIFGSSPTKLVEARLRGFSPAEFAAKLEKSSPKLLLRWTRDAVLVDMKTLLPEQDLVVAELFERIAHPDPLNVLGN